MPLVELLTGAALGFALQLLHEAIIRAKERSLITRCILDRLDATIYKITPFVIKIDTFTEEVDEPLRRVIEELKCLLEKAIRLVEAYAELKRRNLLRKYRYKRRIKELDASLRWMVDVDVQVNQWLDIRKLMGKMSEMNTKLDEITSQPIDIIEATGRSSEEDGCSKPKIDIHFRWKKQTREHEIRFIFN
ncbi:Powdery mildew resistance protein RPW8 domain [Arabidopsis thaliana x Arabidopsis arenosa]|uniref:Powdery mildew resistance protein RPW8 domain n=1 Tax=Arabidopsis thaliana x Arabidopsis arenosa TaxID=1240361 RepID=A0A8T1ZLL3_9BRAS|nr:Powdery mildew resistance protein RPW8 domain [Arabidopsis thaliana x Arabidopsis arenosa]